MSENVTPEAPVVARSTIVKKVIKTYENKAFVSYSSEDRSTARRLQSRLERYRVPKRLIGRTTKLGRIGSTLRPIFRDRSDLSVGETISKKLEDALTNSQCLIVVCSPYSAQSDYVNREIEFFKTLGRSEFIFPIIIDGEPEDEFLNCFSPALRNACPPSTETHQGSDVTLAADAREEGDGEEIAFQKLVASLLGVKLDTLRQRQLHDERRRSRIWAGISTLMVALTGASLYNGYWAIESSSRMTRLLAGTVEDSSQLVRATIASSQERGVPISHSISFLEQAREMLARIGEEPTTDAQLRFRIAMTHVDFAESFLEISRSQRSKLTLAQYEAERAREILRELRTSDTQNQLWKIGLSDVLLIKGLIKDRTNQNDEALELLERAAKLKKSVPAEFLETHDFKFKASFRDGLTRVYKQITVLHSSRSNLTAALKTVDEWRSITSQFIGEAEIAREGLANAYRRKAEFHYHAADLNRRHGRLLAAQSEVARGVAALEAMRTSGADALTLKILQSELFMVSGDVARRSKKRHLELDAYTKAMDLRSQLLRRDPTNRSFARGLAFSHVKLGEALSTQRKRERSLKNFQRSGQIYKDIMNKHPDDVQALEGLLHALEGLADIREQQAALASSEEGSQTSRELIERAHEALKERLEIAASIRSRDESYASHLLVAGAMLDLGEFLLRQGRFSQAASQFQESVKAWRIVNDRNTTAKNSHKVARSLERLSQAQIKLNLFDDALINLELALAIRKDLYQKPKAFVRAGRLADVLQQLAVVRASLGDCSEARSTFEAAMVRFDEIIKDRKGVKYWPRLKQQALKNFSAAGKACSKSPTPNAETAEVPESAPMTVQLSSPF